MTSTVVGIGPRRSASGRRTHLLILAAAVTMVLALLADTQERASASSSLTLAIALESVVIGVAAASGSAKGEAGVLTPLGLFLCVEWVRGCLVPLLDTLVGPDSLPYRLPASPRAALTAQLLGTAFTLCVFVGWTLAPTKRKFVAPVEPLSSGGRTAAWCLVCLGCCGLVLRFRNGDLVAFTQGQYAAVSADTPGIVGFLSAVTRPLLPLGTYLLWEESGRRSLRPVLFFLFPLACLALASYSLNRANLLLPPLAIFLAASRLNGNTSIRRLFCWLVVGSVAFVSLGQMRTDVLNSRGGRFAVVSSNTGAGGTVIATLQLYGQSPYFTGNLYERGSMNGMDGRSFAASLLSPLPHLGADARSRSGSALYNESIYGKQQVHDQILPVWAEAERSFGLAVMLVVGLAAGLVLGLIQAALRKAKTNLELYALFLASLWIAQVSITSVQVLMQVSIYFIIPSWLLAKAYTMRHGAQRLRAS
jgi:hypothetical protein